MYVCNSICFNHESPLRGGQFVTRKITRGVADIIRGCQRTMRLGNIDAQRDWGSAIDYVEAMHSMLQLDTSDDYVISTGRTTSVREFVAMAFRVAGVDIAFSGEGCDEKGYVVTSPEGCAVRAGDVVVEISPEHFRPAEVDLLVGDASKAFKKLGWKPKTSLEQLVQTMVEADCHH